MPRVALDLSYLPSQSPAAMAASKAVIEAGFRSLNGMLKGLTLQSPTGRQLALRVRPMFTTPEKADWIVRMAPGNERAGGLPDHTVIIFAGNRPAVIAHEATHKTFAAADEYLPFREPILHRGQPTLMSSLSYPLAPHSLVPLAQVVSAITGERLTPAER